MEPELDVHGRHAMLFDDDANAAFVNSKEALVEWNSLFIDRYDVRHLLSNPPSSFRNLHGSSSSTPHDSSLESQLDLERYMDLPSSSHDLEVESEVEAKDMTGYHYVPFNYGSSADSAYHKNSDVAVDIPSFRPPFPLPESLLQNLPPSEKLHQIIARTAIFVSEHGGQSEIVLRVKQGDNPTFGFLMPDHHLHPYFRYLVDHRELLKADNDGKSEDDKSDNQTSGALSLLGSVYGSGEDEDGAADVEREPQQMDSGVISAVGNTSNSHQLEQAVTSGNVAQKDVKVYKMSDPSKVKASASSKNRIYVKPSYGNGIKKDADVFGSTRLDMDKSKNSSLFPIPKGETSLVNPPSEVKRLVDRMVEIILKNGKDFEAVLIEQDKKHGKFPFLLPSNQYHPYYLKVLKKAQEARITGKSFGSEKDGSSWKETDNKTSAKESNLSLGELPLDHDNDHDRKEKFKMVINKSKKDSQDQPSKETQHSGISVDAAAAAAILQAATRGFKKPNLDIFSKTSLSGANPGSSNEVAHASNGSFQTSHTPSSALRQSDKENGNRSVTVPIAKELAKTAALAAAGEADSSEAGLTREQKLKAERLRRAKMFAAMIKSGSAPLGKEPLRASSVEPSGCGVSGFATTTVHDEAKEREGSSVPVEAGSSDKMEKLVKNASDEEHEKKSRKRRHYRSRKHNEHEGEEEEDEGKRDENEDEEEEDDDYRRSRKKHKSRRSSGHHRDRSKDRHKHRTKHSSSRSKGSRHHDKHEISSEEDDGHRHRQHKHDSSSEDEHKHHKRRSKHDASDDDYDRKHRRRKHKRSRKDRDERKDERSHEEAELEEGEIRSKSSDQSPSTTIGDDASREASVDVSRSYHEKRTPSLPPSGTTEVPDELRAKIRAMLLATM